MKNPILRRISENGACLPRNKINAKKKKTTIMGKLKSYSS